MGPEEASRPERKQTGPGRAALEKVVHIVRKFRAWERRLSSWRAQPALYYVLVVALAAVGMVLLRVARDQSSTVTSEFKPAPVNSTESSPVVPDPSPGRDTGRLRGPDAHATGLQEQPLPTHGLCYLSAVFDGDRAIDRVYRDVAADVSVDTCPPPARTAIVGLLGSAN